MVDDRTRAEVWDLFKRTPQPLGYDPAGIGVPGWQSSTSPSFAALRFRPWRLRVVPAGALLTGVGGEEILNWQR
ncbi:MAG: hypothetical protein ACRDYA_13300 [Egibacteraceae bacterium]